MYHRPNQDSRPSRIDQSKRSFIPRSHTSYSFDRLSGVKPLDYEPGSAVRGASGVPAQFRNRSADSAKRSNVFGKPRAESAQRSSSIKRYNRPNSTTYRETPDNKYYSSYLQTPQSNVSSISKQFYLTPSDDWLRPILINTLEHLREDRHLKDKRPINDENWQKQTINRLLFIIKEDHNASTIIPSATALRQINTNTFINLTNYVLSKFGGNRFQVNTSTYVEKLPKIARILGYPGVLNKSWLRTVGAQHSTHHVIAFLSYLFEFSAATDEINNSINLNMLYGDNFLILQHNYNLQAWGVFQEIEHDVITHECDAITDEYIHELEKLHNLASYEEMKNKLMELEIKKKEVAGNLEKVKQHDETIVAKMLSLRRKLNNGEQQCKDYRNRSLKAQEDLKHNIILLNNVKHSNQEIQEQIKELRLKLSQQKMSVSEKNEILKKIEQSNEFFASREEILMELKKKHFEKDITLVSAQKKLLDDSIVFNKTMLNVELAIGHSLNSYSVMKGDLLSSTSMMEKNVELKKLLAQAKISHVEQTDLSTLEYQELKMQMNAIELSTQEKSKALECLKNNIKLIYNKNSKTNQEIQDIISKKNNNNCMVEMENLCKYTKNKLTLVETAEEEWRVKLNTLKSQEPLIHKMCEKRMERIVEEHISIAEDVINELKTKITLGTKKTQKN